MEERNHKTLTREDDAKTVVRVLTHNPLAFGSFSPTSSDDVCCPPPNNFMTSELTMFGHILRSILKRCVNDALPMRNDVGIGGDSANV